MHCEFATVLNVENYVYMKNMYHFPYKGEIYSLVFTICQEKKINMEIGCTGNKRPLRLQHENRSWKSKLQLPTALSKANGKHI